MSFTIRIDPSEFRELERDLKKWGRKGEVAVTRAKVKTAYRVEGDAKGAAPVDTGFLKSSIHVAGDAWTWGGITHAAETVEDDEVAVVTSAPYATRMEFEHPTQSGYMRKAAAKGRTWLLRYAEDELEKLTR